MKPIETMRAAKYAYEKGCAAAARGATDEALALLCEAAVDVPFEPEPVLALGQLLSRSTSIDGVQVLRAIVEREPRTIYAWLMLGQVLAAEGRGLDALGCRYRAVVQAQRNGHWRDSRSTPTNLTDAVHEAIVTARAGRHDLFLASYADVRAEAGNAALARVDHALETYLRLRPPPPMSAAQRPRFFYFPGLPDGPYHDPDLQPWAGRLREAWPELRDEACRVLAEDGGFESFIRFRAGVPVENYLRSSSNGKPAWDAFFFYRHGRRYDENHARCPRTSELLEGIELCRIAQEAPEICFSVLAPNTEILPHHGVTNVRLVLHLPLVVPPACALRVDGGGEHAWETGRLMMFDDTYRHAAWNRSGEARIVLLMDCWNPYLDTVERRAVRQLFETIGAAVPPISDH